MRINCSIDNDYSVYRALVVDNKDPKGLGRVRVRIPCYHGSSSEDIPDKDLPWAALCMMGASPQSGSFVVPEKGSVVWVLFENGNHRSPVVLGGVYSSGSAVARNLDQSGAASSRMVPAYQHDVMDEAKSDSATKVVYKSPKGAHILIRDKDAGESIEIRDANGQMLKLSSPMDSVKTKDNKHKFNRAKDNLIARARMLLSNNLGQYLSVFSNGETANIDLVDVLSKMGIEIDGDRKRCRFFNHSGEKVEVSLSEGSIAMQSEGAYVEIKNGKVIIRGSSVELEAPDVKINGSAVQISGSMKLDGSFSTDSPVVVSGVDVSRHYHRDQDGSNTGGPQGAGGAGQGPKYQSPKRTIDSWEEEV